MGLRFVVGLGIAFGFHTLNTVLTPLILLYNTPIGLAVSLPTCLFAVIALWSLQRVR
jgi:lipopolysaccharide export LptBFGC system permease protein LptF